jgi:hypothetical protein
MLEGRGETAGHAEVWRLLKDIVLERGDLG